MREEFHSEVEIMRSLQKPRKFSVYGDDGKIYTFLAKPKDDLRKDARLMDFNTMINKLLAKNSDARRRQLRQSLSRILPARGLLLLTHENEQISVHML